MLLSNMARSIQRTGWQYQSGSSSSENFLLKPDRRQITLKIEVPIDSAEENLLEDNSVSYEEHEQYGSSTYSVKNRMVGPMSPRNSLLSPCNVLRDLPSRQINFSKTDLSDHTDAKCSPHKRRKSIATTTSHARKAMMTRARDELNANEVVGCILSNPNMNQTGLEADHKRMETIRDLNCSLTMKRKMKLRIGHEMTNKRKPSVVKSPTLAFKLTRVLKYVRAACREARTKVNMWRSQLMHVEGKYGSSTTYYFRFLHFLICLNLVTFLLTASFVVIPQLLLRIPLDNLNQPTNSSSTDGDNSSSSPTTASTLITSTTKLTNLFKRSNTKYVDTYSLFDDDSDNQSIAFHWTDLITGAGFLSTTELYYGTYTNSFVSLVGRDYYNLPLAYLLVTIICLLCSLLVLANRVAKAYKQHIVINSGFGINTYCNLVFSGWDFKIRSKKAAKVKAIGIRQEFEAKLAQLKNEANPLTFKEKLRKWTRHLLIHLVVLTILGCAGALIWFLLDSNALKTGIPMLDDMMVPLTVTVLLIVIPSTFTLLVTWEKYIDENTAIYVNMSRMMMLLVTVIGVLCYFWFRDNLIDDESTTTYNCWETRLGEEIYKLLLADLVIVNTVSFVATFTRRYLLHPFLGFPEFNLAWNTWNLIYTQMLAWLGALYMPPVSGLVIIKLLITYYIKQVHIRLNCVPPARPWGASLTKAVFLSLAFGGALAMLLPVGWSIFIMQPSPVCGPFNATDNIFSVFIDVMHTFSTVDSVFAFVINFVSIPGFVAALLVILCAVAFQAKSYAISTKQLRERLRAQVILEGNDKVFLLNMLDGASKALEKMRNSQTSDGTIGQPIFRFSSVKRLSGGSNSRKRSGVQDKNQTVTAVLASSTNLLECKNFGSSSTEQSFITCEPYSPINTNDLTLDKTNIEMTSTYKGSSSAAI